MTDGHQLCFIRNDVVDVCKVELAVFGQGDTANDGTFSLG